MACSVAASAVRGREAALLMVKVAAGWSSTQSDWTGVGVMAIGVSLMIPNRTVGCGFLLMES